MDNDLEKKIRDLKREYYSEYRKNNADKIREYYSKYCKNNIDKIRGYRVKYYNKKINRRRFINFKLIESILIYYKGMDIKIKSIQLDIQVLKATGEVENSKEILRLNNKLNSLFISRDMIKKSIENLPKNKQAVVEYLYLQLNPLLVKEAADKLGVSRVTLSSYKYDVLENLRGLIHGPDNTFTK